MSNDKSTQRPTRQGEQPTNLRVVEPKSGGDVKAVRIRLDVFINLNRYGTIRRRSSVRRVPQPLGICSHRRLDAPDITKREMAKKPMHRQGKKQHQKTARHQG